MNPGVRGTVGLGGMGRLSIFWGRGVRMIIYSQGLAFMQEDLIRGDDLIQ